MVVVGYQPGRGLELDPEALVLSEAAVLGSRYATRQDLRAAIELVAAGRVQPVVSAVYPFADADAALRRVADGDAIGRVAVQVTASADAPRAPAAPPEGGSK
jgi:D-arabinose 1-dehydrogenase-like Zn-dependent alcohol dehydrogenase